MFLGVCRLSLRIPVGAAAVKMGYHWHATLAPAAVLIIPVTTRIGMDYIGAPSGTSEGILSPSPLPRPIGPSNRPFLLAWSTTTIRP